MRIIGSIIIPGDNERYQLPISTHKRLVEAECLKQTETDWTMSLDKMGASHQIILDQLVEAVAFTPRIKGEKKQEEHAYKVGLCFSFLRALGKHMGEQIIELQDEIQELEEEENNKISVRRSYHDSDIPF